MFRSFPEYYDLIEEPMDLSTFKKNLSLPHHYPNTAAALADLRRIWSNCQAFNAEGSEIFEKSVFCSGQLEEMILVTLFFYNFFFEANVL